ncbi:MAG: hypothetical protein LBF77_00020 [Spirochaetaceae bacterium]|jgi:hypothetical protein|nr:hypothetical protein [Spirochaetaceae bacterium]
MNKGRCLFACLVISLLCVSLSAQTHVSVPLDDPVYYILEQAELRGFCDPLPAVKPYSRAQVVRTIETVFERAGDRLGSVERDILEEAKKKFGRQKEGLDLRQGAYRFSVQPGGILFAGELGIRIESTVSLGIYPGGEDSAAATDNWGTIYANGDVGGHFSYGFNIAGGILRNPRSRLGDYWTYYEGFPEMGDRLQESSYFNRKLPVYGESRAYLPYSYRRRWDGSIFSPGDITASGQLNWPEELSVGSSILSELSGTLFGDMLNLRFGRISHEWGGMSTGSSLAFNSAARPFVALEGSFNPVSWFSFSALTGVLEYDNSNPFGVDPRDAAWTNQNFFSIEQLEFNYKNYFHFDLGSTAVWPKRFELGYIFPINNNFIYQNNIGDFDNMAIFANLRVQYPGIVKVWFSLFADEIEISSVKRVFELDRHQFAYQAGATLAIPRLPFSSVSLSYTKIEPYTYTHTRTFNPWYSQGSQDNPLPMETSYTNNGAGIGYYLPPNSDEILLRFETMPLPRVRAHFQYQMIRHGADYGTRSVDGSSYWSELDPTGRSENPVLKKFFLQDGAYQWQHIFKLGGAYTLPASLLALTIFGEAGVVYSYFTDIDGTPNSGTPYTWSVVNTDEYPVSTGIILTLGFRLFF